MAMTLDKKIGKESKTRSEEKLKEVCKNFLVTAEKVNLQINPEKSKYMEVKPQEERIERNENILIELNEGKIIEIGKVRKYNYLGTIITDIADENEEIEARLMKGNKSAGALYNILSAKGSTQ
ncbi:hypothetical protein QE152_g3930 [Popillia japonica]|uniref:Uncharacterized protein n=1 Tax=Popillia japonica TaxID=7064 RepID=A0AAW1N250_POPJA